MRCEFEFQLLKKCQRIHYTELAHATRYLLVVEIDLFIWNGGLFVLETGDDDQTDSNDV